MVSAIILAAGESRRMGQLKPLLKIDGLTFLQHIEGALNVCGIYDISVVVGFEADKIQKESGINARFILNENYKLGQFSSLQCGIQSLGDDCTGVIVCLGDQPQIQPEWISTLVIEFEKSHASIVRPSFHGKSGHPIIYSARIFEFILNLPSASTAKGVMEKYNDDTEFVAIESDGILYDADTPNDLKNIEKFIKQSCF